MIEVYTWANPAAEEETLVLLSYRNDNASRLDTAGLTLAQERSALLHQHHSTYSIMQRVYQTSRTVINLCAGSRVASNCDVE